MLQHCHDMVTSHVPALHPDYCSHAEVCVEMFNERSVSPIRTTLPTSGCCIEAQRLLLYKLADIGAARRVDWRGLPNLCQV